MGTFELAHTGHAAFLRKCEAYADRIVVGVNSDEFVREYKGVTPLYSIEKRLYRIQVLSPSYEVVVNPSAGRELIMRYEPDIVAIGSDWMRKDYLAQIDMSPMVFENLNCALLYLPYTDGISSTEIKERMINARQGSEAN
jgi:glycerol-3-phosphate cytidylyltransferase